MRDILHEKMFKKKIESLTRGRNKYLSPPRKKKNEWYKIYNEDLYYLYEELLGYCKKHELDYMDTCKFKHFCCFAYHCTF